MIKLIFQNNENPEKFVRLTKAMLKMDYQGIIHSKEFSYFIEFASGRIK